MEQIFYFQFSKEVYVRAYHALLTSRSYFNSTIGVKTTPLGRVKIVE
jgi:hypothetical protein